MTGIYGNAPSSADTKTSNITNSGTYYFDGSIWRSMGTMANTTVISYSTTIDPNILGYVASPTSSAADAPATVSVGGVNYAQQGTTNFIMNGHSYAAYSGSSKISWYDAYLLAKNMGGYLATFTTDQEWQYVEQNLLDNHIAFDNAKAWIGFVKFSWFAGPGLKPDPETKWMTGEQPLHDYSAGGNFSVRKINWFVSSQPDNNNSAEGFIHTYSKSDNKNVTRNGYISKHPWNDFPSDELVAGFIVEFQQ